MHSDSDGLTFAQRAALGRTAGDLARAGQELATIPESPTDRRPVIATWMDAYGILTLAASFDGKERGNAEANAWCEMFRGFPVDDVRAAVIEHYRTSPYPIMPAHVTRILEEGLPQ